MRFTACNAVILQGGNRWQEYSSATGEQMVEAADRLNDHLALRFGNSVVWQDVDNLELGRDYLPQIRRQIQASDAVLIVIGPHWLKDGKVRFQNPKDVLRMEIVQALKSKASVIPTLVGDAKMPPVKSCRMPSRLLSSAMESRSAM